MIKFLNIQLTSISYWPLLNLHDLTWPLFTPRSLFKDFLKYKVDNYVTVYIAAVLEHVAADILKVKSSFAFLTILTYGDIVINISIYILLWCL